MGRDRLPWLVSGRPPRPKRQSAVMAVRVQLDGQNLVQLNDIGLEAQSRPRHVEAPYLCGRQSDLLDRLVPMVDEIAAPVAQRQRVMVAEVLLVNHLEADVLRLSDDPAGAGELPIGEDVAVDKSARTRPGPVFGTGDAVVEEQPTVTDLRLQEAEVRRIVLHADVFRQTDR